MDEATGFRWTLVSSHWLTRLDQVQRGRAIGPEQNPSIFLSQMIQQQKVIDTVFTRSLEDDPSIFLTGCFTGRKKFNAKLKTVSV
jgi:hypothetical protein